MPPISDDDLRRVIVGELQPHNAPITLAEYDPAWPARYAEQERRIRDVLGPVARRVEHVGSTSVPGLPAKPIIDMLLLVPDSAVEPDYLPPLEAAGYVLRVREPEWFDHRLCKGPDTNINLHIFSEGCTEADRMLRFRDHLRTHNADRDHYAATKRTLATRTWRHVQDYADAKSAVVADIMSRATG
ncbi:GrpB-like predicted nucleotidyltransferase (UPF0157 family) [Actinokineospora baliensis]|uniref:GrpB family protein n=1 Tax=Actinokineospora baliensis TaxID=547056 RepID=UPI0027DD6C19|nr:GrpB family protein [Actinokineospora baliensis]MBM7775401.1 GrpB-like predicted nucleotidyltransferase (UPF0157 family) [Actinokineospora baliensis]